MTLAVEMRQIEKSFGNNHVLKKVDLTVEQGSIHALLGENGTGKTTLMNILAHILPYDSGEIKVLGTKTIGDNIAFIHQELSLINDLKVFENLYLGRELRKNGFLDKKTMKQETKRLINQLGISLDAEALVDNLNPALKQITEILRALLQKANVIIMDEPTASLTDNEINHLFTVMRTLKAQGVSLIFISHKLNEVLEICDSYTIMRDGVVVKTGQVEPALKESDLTTYMIGKSVEQTEYRQTMTEDQELLRLVDLSKDKEFNKINLTVNKGEIVGITGLLGDGRSELCLSLVGANPYDSGKILLNGQEVKIVKTSDAKHNGISYVPKNRKENGIIKDLSIKENMTLPVMAEHTNTHLLSQKRLNKLVADYQSKLNIKMHDQDELITSLSGGNQQKVILARALGMNPRLVILDNPTQGVDVGAKMEIYSLIQDLAQEGISFIILSSEYPEIEKICNRVYVMFEGQIRKEFSRSNLNEKDVMTIATGGRIDDK